MKATLTGDLWLFKDKRIIKSPSNETFEDKLEEFKRYASDNQFKTIEIANNRDNYVVRIVIEQRTKIDCRMYRDIIIEMFEPFGLVKMVNQSERIEKNAKTK
jgi:hypothetical protein